MFRCAEQLGDAPRAGQAALLLYDNYCFKGQRAVANGWLGRAKRLLEPEGESVVHGNLFVREAEEAHSAGDLELAQTRAQQALDLGQRLSDGDLEADALQCLGRILIVIGRIHEGLALYDQAMLSATEGRLGPLVSGKIYCSFISACEELGELRRAAEWTEVGSSWAASHPFSVFPGLCRVHRAEVLQLRGDWSQAEQEARRACSELEGVNLLNTALGFREVGEVRRRLGDLEGADTAFRQAAELGLGPGSGVALLRLAQGKVAAAQTMIVQALREESWNRLARAKLLPAAVQIAVAAGDLALAHEAADELDDIATTYDSGVIEASANTARGRVQLAEGDVGAATGSFRRALQRWQELDAPYEIATARVLLALTARAAGDEDGAAESFLSAAAVFERLGARADLAWIDSEQGRGRPRSLPDGLTDREVEVLLLVASGATNKAIAQELVLAEKTVDRHVSNIFRKLGVSSRAAATAYAFEHGLRHTSS
jgi:ATP/maltotriose-dependent transcriptional regulator MalT